MMGRLARFVKPIIEMTPPDPASFNPSDLGQLLQLGKHFQEFPPHERIGMIKLMTMSAADLLDEWFESTELKAPMSVSGIIGTFLGVRSPGTAYVLLHHYMGEIDGAFRAWGFCKGGTGTISMALARAAESFGAEIRCEAAIDHIHVKNGKAVGVVMENGDELTAPIIVSSLDPHRTFMRMVGESHLDDDFVQSINRFQ